MKFLHIWLPMSKKLLTVAALMLLAGAVGIGVYLRVRGLDKRPMHCDEANHTIKAGILFEQGEYEYDPKDFHGPTIYYLAWPLVWLGGAEDLSETNETMFRLVPAVFGIALIPVGLLVLDGLGLWAIVVAAVLTAVSPAMSFYSRYYIQEILFVFFTFGAIASGWRYSRSLRQGWMLAAGFFVGLMQATKETSVLVYAAIAAGLLVVVITNWWQDRPPMKAYLKGSHVLWGVVVAVVVWAFFITGNFTNPRGLVDGVTTYFSYLQRADGAGLHDNPWDYYLRTLLYAKLGPGVWWSEGLILGLAAVGVLASFRKRLAGMDIRLVRFLAAYTVVLTALYSVIPYKTPWCLLGFLHGMILLAGVGLVALVRGLRWRPLQVLAVAAFAAGAAHLYWQSELANGRYQADTRNPYVYAHTSSDFLRLARRLEDLAEVSPAGHKMLIKVMTPDCWPLPWYTRKFDRVGYWNEPPEDIEADVIVTSVNREPELRKKLDGRYQVEHYGIRPEVPISVFIEKGLWEDFLKRQAELTPSKS